MKFNSLVSVLTLSFDALLLSRVLSPILRLVQAVGTLAAVAPLAARTFAAGQTPPDSRFAGLGLTNHSRPNGPPSSGHGMYPVNVSLQLV